MLVTAVNSSVEGLSYNDGVFALAVVPEPMHTETIQRFQKPAGALLAGFYAAHAPALRAEVDTEAVIRELNEIDLCDRTLYYLNRSSSDAEIAYARLLISRYGY